MSDLIIRPALPADAADFLRMWSVLDTETEYLLYEPGERSTTLADQENRLANAHSADRVHILTLENPVKDANYRLVGVCAGRRSELKRDEHNLGLIIAIMQEHVGRGYGFRLLEHMQCWASQNAVLRLELSVMTENERAIALYKKFGFEIEGRKISAVRLKNRFSDLYMMTKKL